MPRSGTPSASTEATNLAASLADAGLRFVLGAAGGVAIGPAVGWIVAEIRKRMTTLS